MSYIIFGSIEPVSQILKLKGIMRPVVLWSRYTLVSRWAELKWASEYLIRNFSCLLWMWNSIEIYYRLVWLCHINADKSNNRIFDIIR